MRLDNRRMENMLEIGEICVKPIAETDKDGWKVSLDYRIGQYGRFFPNFSTDFWKNCKKLVMDQSRKCSGVMHVLIGQYALILISDWSSF